jgi:hypothetical protein
VALVDPVVEAVVDTEVVADVESLVVTEVVAEVDALVVTVVESVVDAEVVAVVDADVEAEVDALVDAVVVAVLVTVVVCVDILQSSKLPSCIALYIEFSWYFKPSQPVSDGVRYPLILQATVGPV